jgi:hypothetical protein
VTWVWGQTPDDEVLKVGKDRPVELGGKMGEPVLATITDMPSRVDDMADFVAYYLAKEHGIADAEGSMRSMTPVLVMIRDGDDSAIHRTIGN